SDDLQNLRSSLYIYVQTHTHTHKYLYIHTCVCMRACVCACVYMCVEQGKNSNCINFYTCRESLRRTGNQANSVDVLKQGSLDSDKNIKVTCCPAISN
uniref:Uncharacterized protein n=1 Tax=Apteryx owenii TaxID=8824 RepID=A0A8B9NX35_APTOW